MYGSEILAFALVGIACAIVVVVYRVRRKSIVDRLKALDSPTPIECRHPLPASMRLVREKVRAQTFQGTAWTIKEDNPKGMLMAVASFEQDFGAKVGRLNRQIIMTASLCSTESGGTRVELFYNVFSPFSRVACDEVIEKTTGDLKAALLSET